MFDLQQWKAKIREGLASCRRELSSLGIASTYATLIYAAIKPTTDVVLVGDTNAFQAQLLSLAGNIGGNLIANQIQRWFDNPKTLERDVRDNAELREAIDTVLEKLDAVSLAREAFTPSDGEAFLGSLRDEMASIGNLPRFEATLNGDGVLAQGDGATALGKNAIHVGGPVQGDMLGANSTKITVETMNIMVGAKTEPYTVGEKVPKEERRTHYGYPTPMPKHWKGRHKELDKLDEWLSDPENPMCCLWGYGGWGNQAYQGHGLEIE